MKAIGNGCHVLPFAMKKCFPRFNIQIIIIVVETVWIQSSEMYSDCIAFDDVRSDFERFEFETARKFE